jgi:hypothetical protein
MNAYSNKYDYIIRWNAKSGCTIFRQLFLKLHYEEIGNQLIRVLFREGFSITRQFIKYKLF